MRIKENDFEFEVYCRGCEKVIIVEKPDDLRKESKDGKEMFCLVCPICGREIWFDGIMGYTLPFEFRKKVKLKTN